MTSGSSKPNLKQKPGAVDSIKVFDGLKKEEYAYMVQRICGKPCNIQGNKHIPVIARQGDRVAFITLREDRGAHTRR